MEDPDVTWKLEMHSLFYRNSRIMLAKEGIIFLKHKAKGAENN